MIVLEEPEVSLPMMENGRKPSPEGPRAALFLRLIGECAPVRLVSQVGIAQFCEGGGIRKRLSFIRQFSIVCGKARLRILVREFRGHVRARQLGRCASPSKGQRKHRQRIPGRYSCRTDRVTAARQSGMATILPFAGHVCRANRYKWTSWDR